MVTEDAEIPAPDGTHELEDGTKVETKDGVIVMVQEKVAEIEEGDDEMGKRMIDNPAEMEKPNLMESEMMDLLKEFITKMGEKVSKMEQSYSSLQDEFNSFKKQPAGKKLSDGKTEVFTKENDDTLSARIAALKSLQNK